MRKLQGTSKARRSEIRNLFTPPKLFFYRLFMIPFVRPFVILIYNFRAVGAENVPRKGPFLFCANHSHLLDPYFIGSYIKRPIFQMASNEFFRAPILRWFMWAMGAFPRRKGYDDRGSIKYAIKLVKKYGYPLGIYAEGGRNWDGETLPILRSTAKLIKVLKVPVITVASKGNYLGFPRWANKRRKCRFWIHFSKPKIFDKDTPDEEILDFIYRGIYNNGNYTKVGKIKGKNPATGLPRLLWRCPLCRTIDALTEKDGNYIYCTNCKKEWEVDLLCRMREKGSTDWRAIKEYSDMMFRESEIVPLHLEDREKENLGEAGLEADEAVYLRSKEVHYYHEPEYPKVEKLGVGTLYLTVKRLVFINHSDAFADKAYLIRFEHIEGRSTERNRIFQLLP
jgi:1-acyl-sn-glycerol-3-phosphate acyltransferase